MGGGTIYVASDHNGNAARAYVIRILGEMGEQFTDLGPTEEAGKVDYPEYAGRLCRALTLSGDDSRGILICGTGTGMCIAANKWPGIRAGIATDRATAQLMREHNDCNVLVLGQWRSSLSQMEEMVRAFLQTKFQGGRHVRRLAMLRRLESPSDDLRGTEQ